jgi:hypothetical protein
MYIVFKILRVLRVASWKLEHSNLKFEAIRTSNFSLPASGLIQYYKKII